MLLKHHVLYQQKTVLSNCKSIFKYYCFNDQRNAAFEHKKAFFKTSLTNPKRYLWLFSVSRNKQGKSVMLKISQLSKKHLGVPHSPFVLINLVWKESIQIFLVFSVWHSFQNCSEINTVGTHVNFVIRWQEGTEKSSLSQIISHC